MARMVWLSVYIFNQNRVTLNKIRLSFIICGSSFLFATHMMDEIYFKYILNIHLSLLTES